MNQNPKIAADEPSAKVIALVLLLALLWGGNSVSIKIGLQGVPPFALATMRFLLGFAAITLWSLYRRVRLRMQPGELLPLIFVSAIFTLQISTLNLGTQITEASVRRFSSAHTHSLLRCSLISGCRGIGFPSRKQLELASHSVVS